MKIIIVVILLLGIAYISFSYLRSKQVVTDGILYMPVESPSTTPDSEFKSFSATFEIYTNGTKRNFSDPKYFGRSEDVFINADNPRVITVRKDGITWGDFFETLPSPMKVTKDCLTTGTGQTFCNNDQKSLRFFLNEVETKDALEIKIEKDDKLKVSYE